MHAFKLMINWLSHISFRLHASTCVQVVDGLAATKQLNLGRMPTALCVPCHVVHDMHSLRAPQRSL